MRRVLVAVCVPVLLCFGVRLLQAKQQSGGHARPMAVKPPAAVNAKPARPAAPKAKAASPKAKSSGHKKKGRANKRAGVKRGHGKHRREPQAKSDTQLRQAQSLLSNPTLQNLQAARALLLQGDHDYGGHRVKALQEIDNAINHLTSNPNEAASHIRQASGELGIALGVR